MEKEILKEPQFTDEIVSIIRSGLPDEEIIEKLHTMIMILQEV